MTTFQGADTAQLRDQEQNITTGASALGDRVGSALTLADQVSWEGPDADDFRSRCADVHRSLQDTLEDLRRRSAELLEHAAEQDRASGTGDGSGTGTGTDNPFGPLGEKIGDLFSAGGSPFGMDPGDAFGPFKAPSGSPFEDFVKDRFLSEDRYSLADRAKNWAQESGGQAWEWAMDKGKEAKASKWFDLGKKGVPVIPDLFEIGDALGRGETEEAFWKTNRAALEFAPGLTVGDLLLGEVTGQLGDEHTIFDSDIQWNDGTPMDGLEAYMIQKTKDAGMMDPGELYGEKWADELGVENGTARNVMSSLGGIGMNGLMTSAPVLAVEHGTDYDIQQKIWDGLNKPLG